MRSNEEWLRALQTRSARDDEILEELRGFVERILTKVLRGRLDRDAVLELTQETFTRVLESTGAFRGDAAFTTWVAGVATRVAFTELRKRAFRERTHDPFDDIERTAREPIDSRVPRPEDTLAQQALHAALQEAIANALTERQRFAILSELRGVPTVVIAERLGTNVNALYKLVHDARRKLQAALLKRGFTADTLHESATEAGR